MQNIFKVFVLALAFTGTAAYGQNEAVIQQYINSYKELAIQEMKRTGVPASIKLAQGIHETSAGTSVLVTKSNNHFGIKCKNTWTGSTVRHTDDAPNECFRKYERSEDSYRDHSDFLKNSPRYASLFTLDPLNYQAWAHGLKKAGYATNPRYPQVIIKLIEEYNLQEYTMIALELKAPVNEEIVNVKEEPTKEIVPTQAALKTEVIVSKPVYPSGEFRINETRVIYAKKGTSFLSIAEEYNIPLARLLDFNDMKVADLLEADQLVFLQRKRKTGNEEFHIVKPGETLHDIAQLQAIRLESLLEYNFIKQGAKLPAGEKLYLRPRTDGWDARTSK